MKRRLPAALLVLAVLAAYLPAMRGGFVWDDDDYVVNNQTLRSPAGLASIWFQPGSVPQYYPLVHTTFWIEYHLWGLRPFGYHLVNVLLHAAVSLLLVAALRRLRVPGAWLAGAIFALHPVQVESVAWITERKNVLSGVFYMLAALAYFRFAPPDGDESRSASPRRWYALSLGLFVCALLSKTVAATLPAALLLVVYGRRGRLSRSDWLPLVPFLVLGAIAGYGTAWMERHSVGAQGEEWALSFPQRLLVAGRAPWFYASKLVWPSNLTFIYPRWRLAPGEFLQWLYPAAALAALAVLWVRRRRFGRGPLVAALFFVGTLTPALGFFDVYPMRYSFVADHFQYLAAAGLIALAAAGASRLVSALRRIPAARSAAIAALGAALLLLAGATWRRGHAYGDLETLWRDTIARNPGCWMAQHNLGLAYESRGDLQQAIVQYRKAVEIRPDLETSHFNLATVLARSGDIEGARRSFEEALRVRPDYPEALNNLGNVLILQGKVGEAIERYRRAVALDPGYASAHTNLAIVLGRAGDAPGAIGELRTALGLQPDDPSSMNLLAWLLATSPDDPLRDGPEAVRLAERACAATREQDPAFLRTLAVAYAEAGRFEDAIAAIDRAIERARAAGRPESVETYVGYRDLFLSRRTYRTSG
jgi:tetratricopeptide (TPR) repeat protein